MRETADHEWNGAWLQIASIAAIIAIGVTLWRPAAEKGPSDEQVRKIDDLAALLGSTSPSARAIEDRLLSFAPFPPDSTASRALADALETCSASRLDEPSRRELSEHLYRITIAGDVRAATVAVAIAGIQNYMAAAGCSPVTIDALARAARGVARIDPNPRSDWW